MTSEIEIRLGNIERCLILLAGAIEDGRITHLNQDVGEILNTHP